MNRRLLQPANLLLIIGILFGLAFAIFSPFGTGFDEEQHLARVYDISGFHMLPNRSIYDKTVYFAEFYTLSYRRFFYRDQGMEMFTPQYFGVKANYDSMAIETVMSNYPPLMFFPQGIAAGVGWRLLDLPIIPVAIALRVVTLAVYLLGCYFAIKITPVGKWVFLAVALLPTALYQAATVNGDGYTNAVSLLFIAVVLSIVLQSEAKISPKRFVLLCAVIFLLAMAKPGAILLFPMLLLIPGRVYTSRSQRIGLTLVAVIMTVFHMVWIYFSFTNTSLGVDSTGTVITSVFSQLWQYLGVFWRSLLFHARTLFGSMVAAYGYWEARVPPLVYWLVVAVLLIAILFERHEKPLLVRARIFLSGLMLFAWFGILVLYTAGKFTFGEQGTMEMVQGRYLVAFLPLALLALTGLAPGLSRYQRLTGWLMGAGIVVTLGLFFWGLYAHYYTACGPSLFTGQNCRLPAYQNIEIINPPELLLEKSAVFEQRFTNTCQRLAAVEVLVDDAPGNAAGIVRFSLMDVEGREVVSRDVDVAGLKPLQSLILDLPAESMPDNGEYTIKLEALDLEGSAGLAVRTPDLYPGALTISGVPFDGDLVFYFYCAPAGMFGY